MPPIYTVIYIRESFLQSLCSDVVTFVTLVGVVGVGRYLEISALEWLGGIMALVMLLAKTNPRMRRLTPQQAVDALYEDYGVERSCCLSFSTEGMHSNCCPNRNQTSQAMD